jgi:hypothetical protein
MNEAILTQFPGALARSSEMQWTEVSPNNAWMKVLFANGETGTWVILLKLSKGYVAAPHKHLSSAHFFILKGKLQVRGNIFVAGDYGYEPYGAVHGDTKTLEDTEYLFICNGAMLNRESEHSDKIIGYSDWESVAALSGAVEMN